MCKDDLLPRFALLPPFVCLHCRSSLGSSLASSGLRPVQKVVVENPKSSSKSSKISLSIPTYMECQVEAPQTVGQSTSLIDGWSITCSHFVSPASINDVFATRVVA